MTTATKSRQRTRPEGISIQFVDADAWKSYIPGPWILDVLRTSQPRPGLAPCSAGSPCTWR